MNNTPFITSGLSSSITLLLGGVRAGKSARALRLAESIVGVSGSRCPSSISSALLFVATAESHDEEMAHRILVHQRERSSLWETIEEPLYLSEVLEKSLSTREHTSSGAPTVVVIDCLTLWVSNLLLKLIETKEERTNGTHGTHRELTIETKIENGSKTDSEITSERIGEPSIETYIAKRAYALVELMRRYENTHWILVSNEVGLGIVPPTRLGRVYRDALGRVNQIVAAAASKVDLMVAGLTIPIKKETIGHP